MKNSSGVTMRHTTVLILCTSLIAGALLPARAQEKREVEITAQGILARVDRILEYPRGLIKGRLKHITPDGKSSVIDLEACIARDDYLFKFGSRERGEQLDILYNMRGEDIWVYNKHSLKLYHKTGIDRYDPLLSTNFFYIDLSNADMQSNFTATIEETTTYKSNEVYVLKLKPIFKGGEYGYLTMFVSRDKFIPLRIDYHDRDNAIFKFMNIVRVKEKDDMIIPVRYDMMNIRQGTVTILSFHEFDDKMEFSKDIFRPEKMGE
jgi:hypothetical protein